MNKDSIYGKVAKGEPYRKAGARLTEDAEDVQKRTKLGDPEQQMREYKFYHRFDKAHLVMLAEQGFHTREDATKMLQALRRMEQAGVEKTRAETEAGEHSGEAWLITELGEDVNWAKTWAAASMPAAARATSWRSPAASSSANSS